MADISAFLPTINQVENDLAQLEKVITTEFPQALMNMKVTSNMWAVNKVEKGLVDLKSFTTKYQRTEITTDKILLSEISMKIEHLIKKLRENITVLAVAGITEAHLTPKGVKFVGIFNKQIAYDKCKAAGSSSITDPYATYNGYVKEIYSHIDFADLVQVVHVNLPDYLAITLYEQTKGIPDKPIPTDPSIANWPGIENCLKTVNNFIARIEKEKKATHSAFSPNELEYILKKLKFVQLLVFNSIEARKSKGTKIVKNLDLDISPYLPKPEKPLNEFFSPKDYVNLRFRSVLSLLGYTIMNTEGDGNCFFRATIKSLFPNVPRVWEDSLSKMVRKSLNKGAAKIAEEKGEEYPYQGFVVESVNDSITMAKSGVWADHIQVQKLAAALERPVWLILFDDIQLQTDEKGKLIPGPDYQVGTGENPLLLFFTPFPGHYEALTQTKAIDYVSISDYLSTLEDLIASCQTDLATLSPIPFCETFFKIAEEAMCIKEISENMAKETNAELKPYIKVEVQERTQKLLDYMRRYWNLMSVLTPKYLANRTFGREFVYLDVLSNIWKDTIVWDGEQLLNTGTGPLSTIYSIVEKAVHDAVRSGSTYEQMPQIYIPAVGAWANGKPPTTFLEWFSSD